MNSTGENSQVVVARLTKAAAEAAEFGQWDAVVQCYRDRAAHLSVIQTPIREASDLLKVDEQICDRVRIAQAALVSLLGEAAATRQRLQGLHQRLEVRSSAPVTVSRKV
ncbi:MAG: hypothetical protein P0119_10325 [Nitrospira sp.]|nr:hypothetical protein [Nitrospira sp.]